MDFLGFNVNITVTDSTINMIYLLSCLTIFSLSLYQAFKSLPRVKRAVIITLNSIFYVIKERDLKYFCSQRFIDLGLTIPAMTFWFAGSAASVFLMSVYREMPIELQSMLAFCILLSSALYIILDAVPDTQVKIPIPSNSKYWILEY